MKEHIFLDRTKLLFDFSTFKKFFEIFKHFYRLANISRIHLCKSKKYWLCSTIWPFLFQRAIFLRIIFSLTRYSAGLLHHWFDLCFLIFVRFATVFSLSWKDSTRKKLKRLFGTKKCWTKIFSTKKNFPT